MRMANLTRYNPFGDLDDLFRGFMLQPVPLEKQAPQIIKVDVKENDGQYTVRADIPGIKKEDINVEIDGNVVSISAEVKREKEQKEVDESTAKAKYTDGVLEMTLPKKKGTAHGKIAVQ